MKRLLLLNVMMLLAVATSLAQSQRFAFFEHFTQASCGPCATQNPVFEEVRAQNLSSTHHLAYHTSWPGTDPMNAINPGDVQTRVDYYGVTGVPRMHMLGGIWSGGPAAVSGDLINGVATSAPLRIKINDEVSADGEHTVSLSMIESGDITGGNLRLRVAVVEALIEYSSPPGSNGERDFPNVFREMLTASGGDAYSPAGQGSEQTFSYSYTEKAEYNSEELYILAWLQDDASQEVINSGSSLDPEWQFVDQSTSKFQAGSSPHEFVSVYTSDVEGSLVQLTGELDAPDDWSVTYEIDGVQADLPLEFSVPGLTAEIKVIVTPGTTAGIGRATVAAESVSSEGMPSGVEYTVMSNITDLIIDHGGVASPMIPDHEAALATAGSSTFGTIPLVFLETAAANGLLEGVNNIYNNVAWTFPSITDGEVAVLADFLDNGGNLFISGQDIGWDTWDTNAAANGTAATREFYTNYLKADYLGDGNAANNRLNWDLDDPLYGAIPGSAIVDVHGGNIYPDEMDPIEPAAALYTYNNGRAGAVRYEENGHKVVYVGVDLTMIADEGTRSLLLEVSHDWFNGVVSTEDFDQVIKEALGQSYPNPAMQTTTIPFHDLAADAKLVLTDVTGAVVLSTVVSKGQSSYVIDVSEMAAGSYYYVLQTAAGQSVPQKIQVVR